MKNKIYYLFGISLMTLLLIFPKDVMAENGIVSINGSNYETLEEAIANASEGNTITLQTDLDLRDKKSYVYEFPKNATLDLNNHTVTVNNMSVIYTGINLTIKNGTFETTDSYALFIGDENDTDNVLVENVKTIGGINVFNATNIVLKNVSSVGHTYYSVWADEHAQITIESGNYSTEGNYVIGICDEESSYIYINGGNFTTTSDNLVLGGKNKAPVIHGGIYDTDPSAYLANGAKILKNEDGIFTVGYETIIDVPTFEQEEDKFDIGVSNVEEANQIISETLEKDGIKNRNIKIEMITEETENNEKVIEEMKKTILNFNEDSKISNYFDISINVIDTDSNELVKTLSKLNNKVKFNVLIPKEIQTDSKNRSYYILKNHNGVNSIIETSISEDNKVLTFESDEFSTYALFYIDKKEEIKDEQEDTKKPEEPSKEEEGKKEETKEEEIKNPKTNDNLFQYALVSYLAFVGMAITTIIMYKKKLF